MKNTLTDLNNYLFETLEGLMDDDMTDEEMQKQITKSQAITKVAETIIQNGELALKTMKLMGEYGIADKKQMPKMLEVE